MAFAKLFARSWLDTQMVCHEPLHRSTDGISINEKLAPVRTWVMY